MAGHSQFKNVAPTAHKSDLHRRAADTPTAHIMKTRLGPCAALQREVK